MFELLQSKEKSQNFKLTSKFEAFLNMYVLFKIIFYLKLQLYFI